MTAMSIPRRQEDGNDGLSTEEKYLGQCQVAVVLFLLLLLLLLDVVLSSMVLVGDVDLEAAADRY